MNGKLKHFSVRGDERGSLIALEAYKEIPFDIKRVFYIFATQEGVSRGEHSHHETRQMLIAVNGSCKVTLDDGKGTETFTLDRPDIGLFQDALVWGEMHDFSRDCVLMVLADTPYDEADYIREYDAFKRLVHDSSNG